MGIGTTAPDGTLHVFTATAGSITAAASADDLVVENSGAGGITVLGPAANGQAINFGNPTAGNDASYISAYNNSGTQEIAMGNTGCAAIKIISGVGLTTTNGTGLVIGHDSQITAGGGKYETQMLGTGEYDSQALIGKWGANAVGPALWFLKSRGATIGSQGAPQCLDTLGIVGARADDGNDYVHGTSYIEFAADDNFCENSAPGRIALYTAAQGTIATYPRLIIYNDGDICACCDFAVGGALSKGSGSFNINHPLESKKDTHRLVHSFIEGPQADLIYRGVIELTDGSAEINVDTVSGMTEGTFVALNRCVQAFTNNESNWDNVRGSVTGNTLTIESNDSTSTASISWMVIGERCDNHMMDTKWTDDDGKVIVEPLAPEPDPVEDDVE